MADRYQPNYTGGYGYERFERSRDNDRDHNRRPADSFAPYDPHHSGRSDPREAYRNAPGVNRYEPSYHFRGAANSQSYRPQHEFSFRSQQGLQAPSFPPVEPQRHRMPQRTRGNDALAARPRLRDRDGPVRPRIDADRTNSRGRGRGGRRLTARPAHMRDILSRTQREPTPDHFLGANGIGDTQARFKTDLSSSDEYDHGSGEDGDSEESFVEDVENPAKRRKTQPDKDSAAVPQWSNPDPYTSLPPPETLGAPKKDIVQVIRKAKVDATPKVDQSNAVKDNADFISFSFDEDPRSPGQVDEDTESNSSGVNVHATSSLQEAPGFTHGTNPVYSNTMHRNVLQPPPPPPSDLLLPTDDELAAILLDPNKSRKRKYDGGRKKTGAILEDWEGDGPYSTPWCSADHSLTENTSFRLHKEICDFYAFVKPHPHEEEVRSNLIHRIQRAVHSFPSGGKSVTIRSFGSFAAGLYLPTGDMDLVANSAGFDKGGYATFCQRKNNLHALMRHLKDRDIAVQDQTAVVVASAKVPIIKFVDKETGIKVDISFENDSGLLANGTFRSWKEQYPAMPTLVVLIKQLLAMRGLNEVFSGGVGGFTIICLVTSLLQLYPASQSKTLDLLPNYGDLLYQFLDLYGNRFDIRTIGIVMEPPQYYNKITHPMPKQNNSRLSIIDPNNPMNDIPGGSSLIDIVLDVFREAHAKLQQRVADVQRGKNVEGSLLGCVLGGNYQAFSDQRQRMHRAYSLLSPSSPLPPPPLPDYRVPPRAVQQRHNSPQVRIPPLPPQYQLPSLSTANSIPPTRTSKVQKNDTAASDKAAVDDATDPEIARAKSMRMLYPDLNIPERVTKADKIRIRAQARGDSSTDTAPTQKNGEGGRAKAKAVRTQFPNAGISKPVAPNRGAGKKKRRQQDDSQISSRRNDIVEPKQSSKRRKKGKRGKMES